MALIAASLMFCGRVEIGLAGAAARSRHTPAAFSSRALVGHRDGGRRLDAAKGSRPGNLWEAAWQEAFEMRAVDNNGSVPGQGKTGAFFL